MLLRGLARRFAGTKAAAALAEGAVRLSRAQIPHPHKEATLLMGQTLGVSRTRLLMDGLEGRELSAAQLEGFRAMVDRRERHEPLSYLVGEREFWSIGFAVGPGVLIPRPATEILIETLLELKRDKEAPLHVCDLGVGSGCILTTVLLEYPNATGVGIDVSPSAIAFDANGLANRASIVQGSWFAPLKSDSTFDVVFSNPPYITTEEMDELQSTVKDFEPRLALHGGQDGLDYYRELATSVHKHLKDKDSLAIFEIGSKQEHTVAKVMIAPGHLELVSSHSDHMGLPRCLVFKPSVK